MSGSGPWKESRRGKYRFWHWQYEHAQRTSKSVQDDLKLLISSTRAIPRLSPFSALPYRLSLRPSLLDSQRALPAQIPSFPTLLKMSTPMYSAPVLRSNRAQSLQTSPITPTTDRAFFSRTNPWPA